MYQKIFETGIQVVKKIQSTQQTAIEQSAQWIAEAFLDVYKRQGISGSSGSDTALLLHQEWRSCGCAKRLHPISTGSILGVGR